MSIAQEFNQASRLTDHLMDPSLIKEFSYINGKWCANLENKQFSVLDPATGETLGKISQLSAEESLSSVDAAAAAFSTWSKLLPKERTTLLKKWFDLLLKHKEDLSVLMTLEQGKPLSESRGEIDYAADFIEFYAEEAKRPNIEGVTSHLPDGELEVWREPVGVAALITPWNFPCAMITRKASAALAAGCTVVIHPSAETPFSALALAELAERAGFPAGVFNVVTGHAPDIVKCWTDDPRVRVLSFTGSTEIGKLLYSQSSSTVKKLVLELGGHAPFIVFDDADIDHAVNCAISAKFATSGQDCLAANRIYVARPVYKEFCQKFAAATKKLTVGIGLSDPDIGPLMNSKAADKQREHVEDALSKGAKLLCGGETHDLGPLFFKPTVLVDVPETAKIYREETFGPIAAIMPFDADDDVLGKANDSEYGLIAYLHTKDPKRIYQASRELEYGMVAVNRTKVTGAPIPFGGVKQSGLGREGARQGLEDFTEIKYVCRDFGGSVS